MSVIGKSCGCGRIGWLQHGTFQVTSDGQTHTTSACFYATASSSTSETNPRACFCGYVGLNAGQFFDDLMGKRHTWKWCALISDLDPRYAAPAAPPSAAVCRCPIKDLTSTGHNAGCPEKKR